jgi:hypothetical protein
MAGSAFQLVLSKTVSGMHGVRSMQHENERAKQRKCEITSPASLYYRYICIHTANAILAISTRFQLDVSYLHEDVRNRRKVFFVTKLVYPKYLHRSTIVSVRKLILEGCKKAFLQVRERS